MSAPQPNKPPFPDRRGWHLDKSVSVGHLLTTLIISLSAFAWVSGVEQRVFENSKDIEYMRSAAALSNERVEMLRAEFKTDLELTNERVSVFRGELRNDLKGIADKLDRLIEQRVNND